MDTHRIDLLDESAAFRPGGTVAGVVSWSLSGPPRSVIVGLVWHTEGKGTRDSAVVRKVEFDDAEEIDSRTFTLELPPSPWSFSGTLISVEWALELKITPARGAAIVERRVIVVSPIGIEIDLAGLRCAPDMSK